MYTVYYGHAMEGLEISLKGSGHRACLARKLLGDNFEVLIPEEWQSGLSYETIYETDMKKLNSADIVLADLYNIGQLSAEGKDKLDDLTINQILNNHVVRCHGTLQEIGYAKAKGKYVVEIHRTKEHHHPFAIGADYVASSVEDAVQHIKEKYDG